MSAVLGYQAAQSGELGLGPALLADLDTEIPANGARRGIHRICGPNERPRDTHNVQSLPHLRTKVARTQRGRGVSAPPALQHSPWPPLARSPCT